MSRWGVVFLKWLRTHQLSTDPSCAAHCTTTIITYCIKCAFSDMAPTTQPNCPDFNGKILLIRAVTPSFFRIKIVAGRMNNFIRQLHL